MVVKVDGIPVSIIGVAKGVLLDSVGRKWERAAAHDRDGKAAYMSATPEDGVMLLSVGELKRVCAGDRAVTKLTTVEEVRDYLNRNMPEQSQILSDQALREMLIKSDDTGVPVEKILLPSKIETEVDKPSNGTTTPIPVVTTTGNTDQQIEVMSRVQEKKRRQKPVQPDGFKYEGVVLTPRQVEFMERLSENPGWGAEEEDGWYFTDDYSMELADTMKVTTVGAMVSTLKEKGVIDTQYVRDSGIRRSKFKLTDLGIKIYRVMSRKEN